MWNGTTTAPQAVSESVKILRVDGPVGRPLEVAQARTIAWNGLLVKVYVFKNFGEGPPGFLDARLRDVKESLEKSLKAGTSTRGFSDYLFAVAFLYGFDVTNSDGSTKHVDGLDLALYRAAPGGSRNLGANLMMDPRSFADGRETDTRTEGAFCSTEITILDKEKELRERVSDGRREEDAKQMYFGNYPGMVLFGPHTALSWASK